MAHVHQTIRLDQGELAAGAVLGARFRLEAQIGQGGQAVVFQAVDLRRGGAPVAVKVARQDLRADARREAEEVLRREAGLLRRLGHAASRVCTVWSVARSASGSLASWSLASRSAF